MHSNLEDFAEHVRRQCQTIISRCAFGHTMEAGELAAALCTEAATIVQQKRMQEEVTEEGRYDLARLPGPGASAPPED